MKIGLVITSLVGGLIWWGVHSRLQYCEKHVCMRQYSAPCLQSHSETSVEYGFHSINLDGTFNSMGIGTETSEVCDLWGQTPPPVQVKF